MSHGSRLRGYARRAEEQVHDLADKATQVLDQAVDKGHEFVQKKADGRDRGGRGRAHRPCSGSVSGCLARRRHDGGVLSHG